MNSSIVDPRIFQSAQRIVSHIQNRNRINSFQRSARNMQFAWRRANPTMTRQRRKRFTSGRGVTDQFDRSLIYRKRRMPRRRRRRWRKFNRRINAVSEKDLGSRTVLRNSLVQQSTNMDAAAVNAQASATLALYPLTSTDIWLNDINEISQDTDLGTTGKAIFKSGVIDFTVRNTSERDADTTNPPITLEVDVYEITCGVELGQLGRAQGINGAFDEGMTDTATIPGQATALVRSQRGWTPWDAPSALSEYRLRVWKKTKYFLGENNTFTYQFRDPKRHVVDRQRMTSPGQNLPGLTRFFMFIYKPTPGYDYSDQNPDAYGLSIGVTRKYLYKIMDKTQDYDMYNT